jgi:carboxylesterase type B
MKNKKGLLKVFFIFILNISFALSSSSSNVYDLTTGKYTPIEVEIYGAKIHKLIGVPFTNNIPKAFKTSSEQAHPVSTSDSFVKQATNYSDVCVQPVIFYHNFYGNFKLPHEYQISFDCLSLNIYIPKNNLTNLTAMIFIHGNSLN